MLRFTLLLYYRANCSNKISKAPGTKPRCDTNDLINDKIGKAMKNVRLLQKLQYFLMSSSLLAIYKSFIGPQLRYEDAVMPHFVIFAAL